MRGSRQQWSGAKGTPVTRSPSMRHRKSCWIACRATAFRAASFSTCKSRTWTEPRCKSGCVNSARPCRSYFSRLSQHPGHRARHQGGRGGLFHQAGKIRRPPPRNRRALARHRASRDIQPNWTGSCRLARLTPRERQVYELIVGGKTNKQIGVILGTTGGRTVKAHRHRVMEKMQVRTLAELVSLAERIGLGSAGEKTA